MLIIIFLHDSINFFLFLSRSFYSIDVFFESMPTLWQPFSFFLFFLSDSFCFIFLFFDHLFGQFILDIQYLYVCYVYYGQVMSFYAINANRLLAWYNFCWIGCKTYVLHKYTISYSFFVANLFTIPEQNEICGHSFYSLLFYSIKRPRSFQIPNISLHVVDSKLNKKNKKHSENAGTSTPVTFDLELWPWP